MRLNVVASNEKQISTDRLNALKTAFIAFLLGASLVGLVGFIDIASVHDAAHDSRHALSFPCH